MFASRNETNAVNGGVECGPVCVALGFLISKSIAVMLTGLSENRERGGEATGARLQWLRQFAQCVAVLDRDAVEAAAGHDANVLTRDAAKVGRWADLL